MLSRPFTALGFGVAAWLIVGVFVWVASAPAALGDLTYQDCVGDAIVAAGCEATPEAALLGPTALAISPDGRSVYTATEGSAVLTNLTRAAGGALSFTSCLTSENHAGCAGVEGPLISSPRSIAISADGRSVYVSSSGRDAVEHYRRAPDNGRTDFSGCISSLLPATNCDPMPNVRLQGVWGLAVDPNGGSVYAASPVNNIFTELDRDITGGELDFAACYSDGGSNGCQPAPAGALFGATATAVSPDGASIYVAGSEAIVWFDHGPNGAFRFRGCATRTGGPFGCNPFPGITLSHFSDLAISPDGASLYAISADDNAILRFARAADGSLAFQDCFANDLAGCVPTPGAPLGLPTSVAVSPDSRSVYVGSLAAEAIVQFRHSSGTFNYAGCISTGILPDDGCARLPNAVLAGLSDIVVSPDGTSVYAAGQVSSTIVSLSRSLEDPQPPKPQPEPEQPRARCAGKRATIVGTRRADTLRGTPRRDVIAGLGGNDTIRAGGGNDLICGGAGKDKIVGAAGNDQIVGGPGADNLQGGSGSDRCPGGPGRDAVGCERGQGRRG